MSRAWQALLLSLLLCKWQTVQAFKSFWQRVTLCLPKGRLLLRLPAQSLCSKQWVTYKPASQLAHCLIRQAEKAGVWGQAHRAVAVGLRPVRSPRAPSLETWPSIAQLIPVHCSDRNMHCPWQTYFLVWMENRR